MKQMKKRKETVCVIGLGYVGLPLAVQAALRGYKVYGLENDRQKVKLINSGKSPIREEFLETNLPKIKMEVTTDAKVIKKADIVLVCVPTPVDENFFPDLGPVKGAISAIIKNLKKGQLVVIESTINPGVCEEVVEPMFRKAGYKVSKNYYLAHCPERINPGKDAISKGYDVRNIPRVVGSFDKVGLAKTKKFYESIVDADIMPMASIREAEAVKIVENSFRDINIAFVNELAKSFDKMDIDVTNVIRGAATKPYAFMAHWPSRGVGGHCIPVDPYYLIERAKLSGFDHEFLKVARKINNSMPAYTVELLRDALNKVKLPIKGTRVGVLGVSYKENVADLRESPVLKIIEILKLNEAEPVIFDPYIPEYSNVKSLEELLKKSDAIILATNHKDFSLVTPKMLKKNRVKVVVDGMNKMDKASFHNSGVLYKGIGR